MCNLPSKFRIYVRALHCPTRWKILKIIGRNLRSTREIYDALTNSGVTISMSGLYYHLSELHRAGIIEVAEYREVGGGAPEKVWKLKKKRIVIDLLEEAE